MTDMTLVHGRDGGLIEVRANRDEVDLFVIDGGGFSVPESAGIALPRDEARKLAHLILEATDD